MVSHKLHLVETGLLIQLTSDLDILVLVLRCLFILLVVLGSFFNIELRAERQLDIISSIDNIGQFVMYVGGNQTHLPTGTSENW
jgi:hypothetical protein